MTEDRTVSRFATANPYVGPRTFTYAERQLFFGREREARDLLARVVSERVLLFYAQSGAGKSSLLHTRLIPQLRDEEGFAVLPVGRVSGELPAGVGTVENIYLFNLMASLDQSNINLRQLTTVTLSHFLARLTSEDGQHWYYVDRLSDLSATLLRAGDEVLPDDEVVDVNNSATRYLLIIDQFEEIITTHPNRWREREDFFRQLNQALLDDPNLWVVLTLREDYVAALDPYAPLMADKLRARFYMERMGVAAALEAVKRPATLAGRPFAPGVAERLVDNLRRIKLLGATDKAGNLAEGSQRQSDPTQEVLTESANSGSTVTELSSASLGQYVEPVQLQVVCYQLWQNLAINEGQEATPHSLQMTLADLEKFGDIDQALANFYEDALGRVVQQKHQGISELVLRNWFSKYLITEAGTRGLIFQGEAVTGGIPNAVAVSLAETFLLRSELRSGGIWFELVHDRFITPIVQANQSWIRRQSPLIRSVQAWLDANRDPALLLRGRALKEAQHEVATGSDQLVTEFLSASEAQAEAEQRHFWLQDKTSAQQLPEFDQSYAVIIQIPDKYALSQVGTEAKPTLLDFVESLQKEHGYLVHLQLEDVTRHWLIELFTEILPREVSARDRLLIYIAGAGIVRKVSPTEIESFLIPEDGSSEFLHELISLAQMQAWLTALKCRHTLTIFDGVFSEAPVIDQMRRLEQTPTVTNQAEYDWYTKQVAHQLVSIPRHSATANELPFAHAFLNQLSGSISNAHHSGVVTALEFVSTSVAVQDNPQNNLSAICWHLSQRKHGEYLFVIPNRAMVLASRPVLTRSDNPYRGLEPYEQDDARLFFGRARLIEEITAKVQQNSLTVVLGASGTGKSSLVKAGLAPYISRLSTDEIQWHVLPPIRPVNAPLNQLENLLEEQIGQPWVSVNPMATLTQQAETIVTAIASWLRQHPSARLLLIIDQLEEVVTMCRRQEEREQFIQLVATLLQTYPQQMRIVFTVRSDFEPHFAGSTLGQPLQPYWQAARYVVTPMTRAELRDVVEMPVAVHHLDFQPPVLVDHLLDEVEQTPGALSLLSFTLSELFLKYLERAAGAHAMQEAVQHSLTAADYAELGGVIGSLSRRATQLYEQLDEADRATMQRIMLRMIAVEGGELARRRVPRAELIYPLAAENERVAAVITQMATAQLVLEGSDEAGIAYVEPAHDALVRSWDKLLVWKREAEDILPLQRRLTQVANEWHNSQGADKARLLWHNDPRLPLLQQELSPTTPAQGRIGSLWQSLRDTLWPVTTITDKPTWLNRLETDFVQASIVRRAYNLRQITGIIVAVVLLLAILAGVAQYNSNLARTARDAAVTARAEAEENAEIAQAEAQRANQAEIEALTEAERANAAEGAAREEAQRANQAEIEARTSEAERATFAAVARSRQLAAQSTLELNRGALDLALLVALEARRALTLPKSSLDDSQEAYAAVRAGVENVQDLPHLFYDASADVLQATWDQVQRRLLIRTDHGPVYVWNIETGKVVSIAHSQLSGNWLCSGINFPIWEARWSRDEKRLLTRGADGEVRVWDAENGRQLVNLRPESSGVWSLTIGQNNQCIYEYRKDGVSIQVDRLGGHDDVWEAIWSQDERRVLMRLADGTVRIWAAESEEEKQELAVLRGHTGVIWGARWSSDEQRVLTYSDDDTARIWDANSGEEVVRLVGHTGDVVAAVWNQQEDRVLTRSADATVRVWDANIGKELVRLNGAGVPFGQAVWSQDETEILTYSGAIAQIWDAEQGIERIRLAGHTADLLQATWSPDETRVMTRGADWTVSVWAATTGAQIASSKGYAGEVWQAVWSQDGRRVLTASADGTAHILHVETGEEIALVGHAGDVWEALWNADESRVLTRGGDDTVRIWDAQSGKELVRLVGHLGYVRQALWGQDEERILTYGNDNTLRIWHSNPEELITDSCTQYVVANMDWQQWTRTMGDEDYTPTCPMALLPDDVVERFQNEVQAAIQSDQLTVALDRAHILDEWLQQSGQAANSPLSTVLDTYKNEMRQLVQADQLTEALALANEFNQWRERTGRAEEALLPPEKTVAQMLYTLGVELARNDELAGAAAKFTQAKQLDGSYEMEPQAEARRIASLEWLQRGRELVDTLDLPGVIAAFQRALELDSAHKIEPEREARELIAQLLIEQGAQLALQGEVDTATAKLEQALTFVPAGEYKPQPGIGIRPPEDLAAKGKQLIRTGDVDGALVYFAAERQRQIALARSRALVQQSANELDKGQPQLALLLALEAHRALQTGASFLPDDVQAAYNAVHAALAHLQSGNARQRLQFGPPANLPTAAWGDIWQATWNGEESYLLTRDERGLIGIWDVNSTEAQFFYHRFHQITQYGYPAWEATWSQDEQRILTRGADGTVRIWHVASGVPLSSLPGYAGWTAEDRAEQPLVSLIGHQGDVWQATWSRDEQRILTRAADGTARIWNAKTGEELVKLAGHGGEVWQATWDHDERRVLTFSDDDTARIWDAESGAELVRFIGHEGDVWQATWRNDEQRVLTRSADQTIRIWDVETGAEVVRIVGDAPFAQSVWSADERRILTYSAALATIWDAETGAELVRFAGHVDDVWQATWSADEQRVLTRSADTTVRIWNAKSGEELLRLQGHAGAIWQATWSRDEQRILTTGVDQTARIWNATTGQELARLRGHTGPLLEATWNRDESRVLTRSEDLTVRVWDAQSGTELTRFVGHTDRIQQAVWNQDETRVLTRSDDGTVRLWYVDGNELVTTACQQVAQNMTLQNWSYYLAGEPYHPTCAKAPLPDDLVIKLQDQGRKLLPGNSRGGAVARGVARILRGDYQGAQEQFQRAWRRDYDWTAPVTVTPSITDITAPRVVTPTQSTTISVTVTPSIIDTTVPVVSHDRPTKQRMGSWAGSFNLSVIPIEQRPDKPTGEIRFVVKDIFTTRDGSWEPSAQAGSIDRWAREYLKPFGAPDYFDDAGGDHHLFAAVIGLDGKLITEQAVRYWIGGTEPLADLTYGGFIDKATNSASGWATLPLDLAASFAPANGASGPWCWAPIGAAEIVCGGGLPDNLPISTFVVWQAVPAATSAPVPEANRKDEEALPAEGGSQVAAENELVQQDDIQESLAPPDTEKLLVPSTADRATTQLVAIWNQYGGLLRQISEAYEIDLATTVAVFAAEQSGPAFSPDGRLVIRFENHLFWQLWGKENEAKFQQHFAYDPDTPWQGHQWRSNTSLPWQPVHDNQQQEWQAFAFAQQLDETAAKSSISMGLMQLLGLQYARLGYPSVQEMFQAFATSEQSQIEAFFGSIQTGGMITALQQGDFFAFANFYNGPGQATAYTEVIERNLAIFRTLSAKTNAPMPSSASAAEGSSVASTAITVTNALTRTARVGIVGRNSSDFTEADYALLQTAKIEAIVLLSNVDPQVFAQIKERNPEILIITRLFAANKRVEPDHFVAMMAPVIERLKPYSTHFQITNEPNHFAGVEGWGSEDADAMAFNTWFLAVYEGLKALHPWAQLGFPPLAVPDELHRDKAWLRLNQEAIERADWLGVHSYWQTQASGESLLFMDCCGLNFTYYHQFYPNKPLHIVEFGNSNGQTAGLSIHQTLFAEEYVQWLNEVFNYSYIHSASAFIMSSSDPAWESFAWRDEDGRMKQVVAAVGMMDRPSLMNTQEPREDIGTGERIDSGPASDTQANLMTSNGAVNAAASYGVTIDPVDVTRTLQYWRVSTVRHLPPDENRGRHHIYVDILDEAGEPLRDPDLHLEWGWIGQQPDEVAPPSQFDRSVTEPATNLDMMRGPRYWIKIGGDGLPSDVVRNLHSVHPDETGSNGEIGNSIGHHSFSVVFQRTRTILGLPFAGNYPITQHFGENPEFYSQFTYDGVPLKGNNRLIFALPLGTSVLATDDGVVLRAESDPTGLGNYILLRHNWGESLYSHLSRIDVVEGQTVPHGTVLGLSGSSGATNAPMLSFGIRINPYKRTDGWGGYSDPLPYLNLDP